MYLIPFISNDILYYPKIEIIKFLESQPYSILLNFISGQSLKYIRSQQPVLIFSLPNPHYENTLRLFEKINYSHQFQLIKFTNSYKVILHQEQSEIKELHLIIQKPFVYSQILTSIERLRFDPIKFQWVGDKQDLIDFYNGTLRIIKPEEIELKHIIQLFVYSSLLNFNHIDSETIEKIRKIDLEKEFQKIDISFLRNQFSKILTSAKPSRAFIFLEFFGILKYFLPELVSLKGFKISENNKNDLFHHCIYNCDSISEPILHLRIAALFRDIGKSQNNIVITEKGKRKFLSYDSISANMAHKILKRIQFSHSLIQKVDFLIRNNLFFYSPIVTEKSLRKFVKTISENELKDLIHFKLYERKKKLYDPLPPQIRKILFLYEDEKQKQKELKIKDLEIKGENLKELNIPEGPIYGKTLKYLLEKVKNKEIPNRKEILLEEAKFFLNQEGFLSN